MNPDANTVWIVLIALATFAGNLATIGIWLSSRKRTASEIYPQPLTVKEVETFVPREDFEAHKQEEAEKIEKFTEHNHREHENLFSKIGGVERGVEARLIQRMNDSNNEAKASRQRMHAEITEIGKHVASLQTASDLGSQRIAQMDAKIDRLLDK